MQGKYTFFIERIVFLLRKTEGNNAGGGLDTDTDAGITSGIGISGNTGASLPRRLIIYAWTIGALYAATDELHQLLVTDRSGELRDVCIDAAGVLAGVLLVWLINRKKEVSGVC